MRICHLKELINRHNGFKIAYPNNLANLFVRLKSPFQSLDNLLVKENLIGRLKRKSFQNSFS